MTQPMDARHILDMAGGFKSACVLMAAAELDLFRVLAEGPLDAVTAAERVNGDLRATTALLDALVALGLSTKQDGRYGTPESLVPLLAGHARGSVLAMVRHQANCLRRWTQLAEVVRTGRPAVHAPSVRGEDGDRDSFITAMDDISAPVADRLVSELSSLTFDHLLDVGGASGTWTLAFLRHRPHATATLFDLPAVMPLAEARISRAGMADRITLAPGDLATDSLPEGANLAWISAIVHMLSREQNRGLYEKVHTALRPDGTIVIRDVVMEPDRTSPPGGALFAINMLVGTEGGGTFTFDELREDLEAAGFTDVAHLRTDPWMDGIVTGKKPGG